MNQLMNNYFFVDGGALLSDIGRARRELGIAADARLDLAQFVGYFVSRLFEVWHANSYRRFTFYFVKEDDERLNNMVIRPQPAIAISGRTAAVSDVRLEYCGKRIRQFQQAREWLDQHDAPENVKECLYRSEKAVDTQICCDALQLAGTNKLDRLFLYTNDFDFIPLCRTLRQLGANINLFRLRATGVNVDLARECDAFHEMDEAALRTILRPPAPAAAPAGQEAATGSATGE